MLFPATHQASEPVRVVVTGAGVITSLGNGWERNADQFRRGATGFRTPTVLDVSRQRVKLAGEVALPSQLPQTRLDRTATARMERAAQMLVVAAAEAWSQSGWSALEYLPIVLGTTSGGMTLGQEFYRQAVDTPLCNHGQVRRLVHYQAQRQGLDLADAFGIGGPLTLIANACASGANAIGQAWQLVRRGAAAQVLTGGYDALSQLVFAGFDSLQALSPTQCRPFDATRDGLALGEGAAILALESLDSARRRDAHILAEIVGYGASTDLHHLTQPHPTGDAAYAAMTAACTSARVTPEQIGYINAHGTGTLLNDSAEALAINRWAGPAVRQIQVSSTKAGVGHLLGAAGAVEALVSIMALQGQWLPPTSATRTPDPACLFPLVLEPQEARFSYALSNSFGFGGANATLIFRRWS